MTRFTSFVNILRNWFGSCSCLVIQKLAGLFLKISFSQIFFLKWFTAKQRFVKLKNKRTSTTHPRSTAARPSHHRDPCAPIPARGGAGAAAAPSQDGGVRASGEAGVQAPQRPRRRPGRHLAAAQVTGSAARSGAERSERAAGGFRLSAFASPPRPEGHLGGRAGFGPRALPACPSALNPHLTVLCQLYAIPLGPVAVPGEQSSALPLSSSVLCKPRDRSHSSHTLPSHLSPFL